jgi:hypothetical protein
MASAPAMAVQNTFIHFREVSELRRANSAPGNLHENSADAGNNKIQKVRKTVVKESKRQKKCQTV